jgi:hypothetical protein
LTPNSRSGSAEIDNDPKSGKPQSTADALVSFRGHSHGLVEMLALIRMTLPIPPVQPGKLAHIEESFGEG